MPRADHPRFKTWTDAVIGLLSPDNTEEREVELVGHLIQLFQYLEAHLKKAATEMPGRIIHVLATMNRRDGTPFTALERSWMLLTTFVGGNETTMNMLAMGMRKLATQPALQTELRGSPQNISRFVEEMLRLEGSVQALLRVATRDVEIDGVVIPSGDNVVLCSGSANPRHRWDEPGFAWIAGRAPAPDFRLRASHLHQRHLARRELNIAFATLLDRLENIELAIPAGDVEQVPLPFHRAIARLPVRFAPRGQDPPSRN